MKDSIVQVGDPVLRERAKPVLKKDFDSRKIHSVIERMKKALAKEEFGVAIAAPQIGESLRIFVVAPHVYQKQDADRENDPTPKGAERSFRGQHPAKPNVFINPEIVRLSRKKHEMSEGCLSVRGKYGTVLRSEKATVKAYDQEGKPFTHHGSGLLAHIFQHEVDHLDGTLYVDKALKLEDEEKREELREEYPA